MLRCLNCLVKVGTARGGEYVRVIFTVSQMIVDMVNYHRGFLLADNLHDLTDKFFGVVAEQGEFRRAQSLKDFCGSATCDVCSFRNLPDKVILD